MKRRGIDLLGICFMLLLGLGSCIKEEALNMEADIVGVRSAEDVFLLDPVIANNQVTLYLKPNSHDLAKLNINFDLTPGATIKLLADSLKMPVGEQDTSKVLVDQLLANGVYYQVTSRSVNLCIKKPIIRSAFLCTMQNESGIMLSLCVFLHLQTNFPQSFV